MKTHSHSLTATECDRRGNIFHFRRTFWPFDFLAPNYFMKENVSKGITKDYPCFKIKSYIAFWTQFLSSPCFGGKKVLPPCCFSRWGDKQHQPMASLQARGAHITSTASNLLQKNTQTRQFLFFSTSSWCSFCVIWHPYRHTSGFVKPSEASKSLNPLVWRDWAGERGKTWKWRCHLQISYHSICKITHNSHCLICKRTHT